MFNQLRFILVDSTNEYNELIFLTVSWVNLIGIPFKSNKEHVFAQA